ncbi:GDP-mannose 4,6-dehydratase [candidate division FCPU426 bacterium]|nr:GDP-mannose 4,6-dehydratase [candidate division FCPU426 bacterium]
MRVLITGMEGFVGSHLAEFALARRAEVHGTAYPGVSLRNLENAQAAVVHSVDITEQQAVEALVQEVRPKWIFHLAGQSNPNRSHQDPETTLRVNVLGNLNVLESVRKADNTLRVLVAGSADEYGGVGHAVKYIRESQPLSPDSPYAVSKVCQDMMGLAYFTQYGLPVIRTRPFNHIGPRQALGFVATDFASQIVSIELGRRVPAIEVGNLDVIRDFSDVRDIVAGYWALMEKGEPGEVYNIGTGRGITVRALLKEMLSHTTVKIKVDVKHQKVRAEKLRKVAAINKITRATGWKPRIPLAETVGALIQDWRGRLR